jgi:hypothetical protein
MAQRSRTEILAARTVALAGLTIVDAPMPKASQAEELTLEVLLDIRQCMQKILVTCGGENLEA